MRPRGPGAALLPAHLALLHPFPSTLDAAVVLVLALLAGTATVPAVLLAGGMLLCQLAIGSLNDIADAPRDAGRSPPKPIPSGRVRMATARALCTGAAAGGVLLTLAVSPVSAALALAGLAVGAAYDLVLKPRGLGWVAFAAGFPLLLTYAWSAPGAQTPVTATTLLVLAAIAGPALQLANGLADDAEDAANGVGASVVRIGRPRAIRILVVLVVALHLVSWAALLGAQAGPAVVALLGVAGVLGVCGLVGSARGSGTTGRIGWGLQALATAALGIAWAALSAG
ncbi:MAG: UbiA family prenyltransferase [Chloroflexota bacterium]